jgi:hypothetical protein
MTSISIEEGPKLAFLVRGVKGGMNGDIGLKLKAWEKRVDYIRTTLWKKWRICCWTAPKVRE